MGNITKEFIDELFATQEKLTQMYKTIKNEYNDIIKWECENVGRTWVSTISDEISEICIADNGNICIKVEDEENYYDEYECPLYKFISNDWKAAEIAKYQVKLKREEEIKKAQMIKKAKQQEERERAEYERLKAKYE